MAYTAIVGASGLLRAGDARPRARPSRARPVRARLRLARRAGRERARPAPRPQRRTPRSRLRDERGGAGERRRPRLRLPRPRAGGGARAALARRGRRPLRRAPAERTARLYAEWYGFDHPRADELEALVVRDPRALPPAGAAGREPRLLRDRRAAGAPAAAPGSSTRRGVVVDAKSGVSGAGKALQAELARRLGARERLRLQGRATPARARDRAGARLPRLLRPAPPPRPARAHRDVLRRRRTRPRRARCSRPRTRPRRR